MKTRIITAMLFNFVFLCLFWRFVARESSIFKTNASTRSKVEFNNIAVILSFYLELSVNMTITPSASFSLLRFSRGDGAKKKRNNELLSLINLFK